MSQTPQTTTYATISLRTIGRCIYCMNSQLPLTDEHIVALSLGGEWVLKEASCTECSDITSRFELQVSRGFLWVTRAALGLPSRRPLEQPVTSAIQYKRNGCFQKTKLPISENITAVVWPIFTPPAYLEGRPFKSGISLHGNVITQVAGPTARDVATKLGTKAIRLTSDLRGHSFMRMLSKIAYGFAVGVHGTDAFKTIYVLNAILGASDDIGRWLGCGDIRRWVSDLPDTESSLPHKSLHVAQVINTNEGDVIVRVRLFAQFRAPEYLIVVGRLKSRESG